MSVCATSFVGMVRDEDVCRGSLNVRRGVGV